MKKGKNLIFLLVVIVVGFVFFHSNVNAEETEIYTDCGTFIVENEVLKKYVWNGDTNDVVIPDGKSNEYNVCHGNRFQQRENDAEEGSLGRSAVDEGRLIQLYRNTGDKAAVKEGRGRNVQSDMDERYQPDVVGQSQS